MKMDLEMLGKAKKILDEVSFCQDCGETEPDEGFYPMYIWSTGKLSSLLCKKCERKRRGLEG